MTVITLTTDFGSLYPASMKGVILSINPDATIVDITHSISPANIHSGAFALYSVVRHFPEGTIHVAVIDPGVGTDRKAIVVKGGDQYFVGPDNGLLIPAAKLLGDMKVYEIQSELIPDDISSTFHGRDIFAPVAAYISKGMDLKKIGKVTKNYVDMDFSGYEIQKDFIRAEVLYIDDFGNIITSIPEEEFVKSVPHGSILSIAGRKIPFLKTYGDVPKGQMLSIIGSHGFFEIAVNMGSASRLLHLNNGNEIIIGVASGR